MTEVEKNVTSSFFGAVSGKNITKLQALIQDNIANLDSIQVTINNKAVPLLHGTVYYNWTEGVELLAKSVKNNKTNSKQQT